MEDEVSTLKEIIDILREHAHTYPRMQPQDAVKLVYQSEWGVGHLIQDLDRAKEYLREELLQCEGESKIEYIGNGFIRYYLGNTGIDSDLLVELMSKSASHYQGSQERFLLKLDTLRKVCAEGHFHFSLQELELYLEQYAAKQYPMVSHSDIYRNTYHPHYRVLREEYVHTR